MKHSFLCLTNMLLRLRPFLRFSPSTRCAGALAASVGGLVLCLMGCKDQKSGASGGPEVRRARVVEVEEGVVAPPTAAPEETLAPDLPEAKNNNSAQVAILCYHDFVENTPPTEMRIDIRQFRKQMQAIQDAKLPVISLTDFLAWKRGKKSIPDSSVMITIDDGYNSVYHLAAPIMEEFGYPYSVFLYKNYVNGGGRALTTRMIKELMAKGCEVGSHSVSHPLNIARVGSRTQEEYETFLNRELGDSKTFLEEMFAVSVNTYAHPGGTYTQRILELGPMFGYEFMFSVNPAKAMMDSPVGLIPRYVVLGNDKQDRAFHSALNFRGVGDGELGRQLLGELNAEGQPLVQVYPGPDSTIAERSPLLAINVNQLEGLDPASISVKVAGLGQLEARFDKSSGRILAQVEEILRTPEVFVHVSFSRKGQERPDVINWKFFIDLQARYLPPEPREVSVGAAAGSPPKANVVAPDAGTAP